MAGEESTDQKLKPESISASKAEERLSSRDGGNRPGTNQSSSSKKSRTLLPSSRGKDGSNSRATPRIAATPTTSKLGIAPPENTPRDVTTTNDGSALTSRQNGEVTGDSQVIESNGNILSPLDQLEENILDEDELFMTLTDEERNEWEAMMADRSKQLEETMSNHKTWSENFTKRRMYVYCRMRKILASYTDRSKFLSDLTNNLNQVSSRRRTQEANSGRGGALNSLESGDASLVSPRKQKSSKSASLNSAGKVFSTSMPSVPEHSSPSTSSLPPADDNNNLTTE